MYSWFHLSQSRPARTAPPAGPRQHRQGLLVGVEFDDTISGVDVKHGCLDRHLLITAIGAHTIRMVPPLIITEEDCDQAAAIIEETVNALSE